MKVLVTVVAIVAATVALATGGGDPEKDPRMKQLLQDAVQLIKDKSAADAIPRCDTVISAYAAHYQASKRRIFCARSSAQSLISLLPATADGKDEAIVLSPTWAEAYFLKAFALEELHRASEAKASLMSAVALSPFDSHYLNELADIFALEKNWGKAAEFFALAEDRANTAPDLNRADELARAKRGQGYVLVELGKLDEAEQKYEDCLATNPNDQKAKRELAWIQEQKAKRQEKKK